jgi:putative DNA primase/helicase
MHSTNMARDARADFMTYTGSVKAAATGRWPAILADLGIPESALRNRHGPCPGCGGRDRFRFDNRDGRGTFICSQGGSDELAGDGFALLEHCFGLSFVESLRRVGDLLHVTHPASHIRILAPLRPLSVATCTTAPVRDPERAWRAIGTVLSLSRSPAADGPVARYLAARGLSGLALDGAADLREVPRLRYYNDSGSWTAHPAMVAAVRNVGGRLVTLHRIYLNDHGRKANVASPKRLMTPATDTWLGGAVQLYEPHDRLALAEGVESALAVRLLTGWPVWSTVTAGGLEAVQISKAVRRVAIHADHDPAGLAAAERLQARLRAEGRDVDLVVPPEAGMDPLDVLTGARHE